MPEPTTDPNPITDRYVRAMTWIYPAQSGLALTIRAALLVYNADVLDAEVDEDGEWAEELELAHAVVHVFQGDPITDRAQFWKAADESSDLSALDDAVSRVPEEIAALSYFAERTIILDDVTVAPAHRRQGLGRQIAALTLDAAGAWTSEALVIAIAGARDDKDETREASAALLRALGLQPMPVDDLWAAATTEIAFQDDYRTAMQLETLW
ncbi:MAG: GNAT family N-acetyltransferase [Acidimicrobiales bacterium]